MKYSDNITIQKFIEQLIDVLKYENIYREPNGKKLDIPFLVSVLWQDLTNNYECYNEFCSDLRDWLGCVLSLIFTIASTCFCIYYYKQGEHAFEQKIKEYKENNPNDPCIVYL